MSESGKASVGAMVVGALLAVLTAGSAPWWWPKSTTNDVPAPETHVDRAPQGGEQRTQQPKPPVTDVAMADLVAHPTPQPLYRAMLSCADHRNSSGVALRDAAMIVRQDRANLHELKRPDAQDAADGAFTTGPNREALQKGLRITPEQARTIVTKTPTVAVFKNGSVYRLEILQEGSPLDQCPDAPAK